jgi:hypothetical protein
MNIEKLLGLSESDCKDMLDLSSDVSDLCRATGYGPHAIRAALVLQLSTWLGSTDERTVDNVCACVRASGLYALRQRGS